MLGPGQWCFWPSTWLGSGSRSSRPVAILAGHDLTEVWLPKHCPTFQYRAWGDLASCETICPKPATRSQPLFRDHWRGCQDRDSGKRLPADRGWGKTANSLGKIGRHWWPDFPGVFGYHRGRGSPRRRVDKALAGSDRRARPCHNTVWKSKQSIFSRSRFCLPPGIDHNQSLSGCVNKIMVTVVAYKKVNS